MDHRKNNSKKGGWWPFPSGKTDTPVATGTTGTPTTPTATPEKKVEECIKKCREPKKGFLEGIFGSKTPTPTAPSPPANAPAPAPAPANAQVQSGGKKRRSKGSKLTRKNKKRKGTRRCSRK